MAIPIIHDWQKYFENPDEGLGSSYERIVINNVIHRLTETYHVDSILECPSFGFTGLSGINLMAEGLEGRRIYLEDHDAHRLNLIKGLWREQVLDLKPNLNPDYQSLEYVDKSIDMAFNFSALWFAPDLKTILKEICRVTAKVIMISVPNQHGIGFKMQMKDYRKESYPELHPENIDPALISVHMRQLGWKKIEANYFDCPPWPDIGMSKEDFLAKTLKKSRQVEAPPADKAPLTILNYFRGEDPGFRDRMLRFYSFERYAPTWLKKHWAHHYYMVFVPDEPEKTL